MIKEKETFLPDKIVLTINSHINEYPPPPSPNHRFRTNASP